VVEAEQPSVDQDMNGNLRRIAMRQFREQIQNGRKGRVLGGVLGLLSLLALSSWVSAEHAGPGGRPTPDPSLVGYAPTSPVSGSLRISGSDTMQPLLNRLAIEFRRRHPDALVTVEGGGSAGILKEFLGTEGPSKRATSNGPGSPLLAASSRALNDQEIEQFVSRYGYKPTVIPVAVDAVGIYVHRDNPLQNLTLEQVDAIFSTTRNRGFPHEIRKWGQLGLNNGWEQAQIKLYGRNQKSGTRAFIKEHVLQNGEFNLAVIEEPGAASVILAVGRDPFGMGYSGVGLQSSSVRAVSLAEYEGKPFVSPSVTNVMDSSYPLRRFLYLYVNKPPAASLSPVAKEFLTFVNSRDGQEAVIRAGFFPLPAKQVEQSLGVLLTSLLQQ
jgi:phosphate transport system substrate-binding protein